MNILKPILLCLTLALTGAAVSPCSAGAPTATAQADDTGAAYKKLADQVGPALVSVKYILKMEGGQFGGDDEGREAEITGLMIEAGGLVLCSNFKMGGFASFMGGSANPTDIKVLSGDDTEGLKAKVLARDTDLDLCWVQIEDDKAKGKTFPHLDLKSSTTASLGDKVMAVQRKSKFFDHALVVSEGRIGGTAKKPRSLVIPSGINVDMGMPAFTADGKLIGIGVLQLPSREDMEGGDMSSMFEDMGSGGMRTFLLPAEEVAKATERGKAMGQKEPSTPPSTPDAEKKPEDEKK